MQHGLLLIVFFLLLLPGIVGVILPVLPGLAYMFVIALVFGSIDTFNHLRGWELGILGGVAGLSLVVDYSAGVLGAKWGGASKQALGYGFIGLIAGLILFPPFGGIVGLFGGILLAEMRQHKDKKRAVKAASGGVIGSVAGMAINLVLALIFIVCFTVFALR